MRKQGKYWSQEAITFWITFISPRYLWKVEGLGKGGTCFFTGSKICAGKKDLRGGLSPTIPGLVPRAVYIQASHPILLNFCFYRALHDFFTNWTFVAMLRWTSLLVPFFQWHLLTACLCVMFWWFLQYFKFFLVIIFVNGDLWAVIMIRWKLRWQSTFFNNKVVFN